MKPANCRVAFIVLGIIAWVSAAPFCGAQEKGKKKRPHTSSGAPFVHRVPLRDDQDIVIEPPKPGAAPEKNARPLALASMTTTCGKCHELPTISSGWHFNAANPDVAPGRPGEPWILTDDGVVENLKYGQANTRTQIPLSYRNWPGTWRPGEVGIDDWKFAYAFGRQLPGGGIFETSKDQRFNVTGHLQNDCLICHLIDNSYDGNARYDQIVKKQNFKYATLAGAEVGFAEKSREKLKDNWTPPDPKDPNADGPSEPKFEYDLSRFDPEGHVLFNVSRRVPNERCLFCHTTLDTGTPKTDDLTNSWRHDRDIHLVKGMMCVDCHRNGLDHEIVRGYEGEAAAKHDGSIVTLSCQGCHMGNGDATAAASDLGGRNAAPRPQHKGLPTIHFEKLSCTACHSGPYPGKEATSVLTSMAHRLGIESFNRVDDAAPALQEPVFLRVAETGKITPHKVFYPTFWARLNGTKISPIAPDILNSSSKLRKLFGPKPDIDGHPAKPLTNAEVVKILDAIAAMEAPEPAAAEKTATKPATTATTAPATPPWYTGEPIFVTGGKCYKRSDGQLVSFEPDPSYTEATIAYAWPLAHNVRGAQQALGARGCTDCHASGTPIFDSKVSTVSLLANASTSKSMKDLRGEPMGALEAFASTYPMRPLLMWTGFICAGILFVVLVSFAGRAIGMIGARR
jgi:hypothetical protein